MQAGSDSLGWHDLEGIRRRIQAEKDIEPRNGLESLVALTLRYTYYWRNGLDRVEDIAELAGRLHNSSYVGPDLRPGSFR